MQILDFLMNHWFLTSMLTLNLMLLWSNEIADDLINAVKLSPEEVVHKMNSGEFLLVDVREKADFKKGCILGSVNIPKEKLKVNINKLLSRNKTILLICQDGTSSPRLVPMFKAEKGTVFFLDGGIEYWKNSGFPLGGASG